MKFIVKIIFLKFIFLYANFDWNAAETISFLDFYEQIKILIHMLK